MELVLFVGFAELDVAASNLLRPLEAVVVRLRIGVFQEMISLLFGLLFLLLPLLAPATQQEETEEAAIAAGDCD